MEKYVEFITFIALLMGGLSFFYTIFLYVLMKHEKANLKRYRRMKKNED